MSGFLSKYLSDMLCVCINDSDPAPQEESAATRTHNAIVALTDVSSRSRSSSDRSVKPNGKPTSEISFASQKSASASASVAVDCFKEGLHAQECEDYTQAISFYKRAVELNPKFCEAHSNLGDVFLLCKNALAAEKHFKIMASLDQFDYKVVYKLGYLYLNELNRPEEAVTAFRNCLDMDPMNQDALISLGLSYMELRIYADAVECFKKLLADYPNDIVARFNLGNAYLDMGAYSDAVSQYLNVLELEKNHVDASFNLAIAYQHMAHSLDMSVETRLRYLSSAMRCYIQISSWKDNIPRHFVVEALKGIETVRKEQTKYSNSQVASNTIANEVAARSRSVGVSRVQAPPKRLYNSTNELVEPTSSANMAQYSSERISDTNLKDFAENPQDLESVATTERTKEENSANDPIIVDNTKAVP